jgi:capsular polysaccharide transport system permease protein
MNIQPDQTSLAPDVVAFDSDIMRHDPARTGDVARARPSWLKAAVAWLRRSGPLFWVTVLLSAAVGVLYFGFIASDVYVSESRFVVRSPEKPAKSGLGVLLSTAGFANASDEVRAAQGYIQSRDALRSLDRQGLARNAWGKDSVSIFDRFDPIGIAGSFEELYLYYKGKVGADFDSDTGITTLSVRAFSPREAQLMNLRLLEQAEALVNQLNERGQGDLIRYAEREVAESQDQARIAAAALAAYRNKAGVIDPERQATVQLQMISKLQDELIGARMQLLQLSSAAAQNPQIPLLKIRIRGLERAIDEQLGTIAGNSSSLSATAAQYQRFQLEREFADRQLAASLTALQDARNEARRQRAYVERIAQPSLPDDAMEPRRIRGILATMVFGLVAWGVLSMLLAGVREHRD